MYVCMTFVEVERAATNSVMIFYFTGTRVLHGSEVFL